MGNECCGKENQKQHLIILGQEAPSTQNSMVSHQILHSTKIQGVDVSSNLTNDSLFNLVEKPAETQESGIYQSAFISDTKCKELVKNHQQLQQDKIEDNAQEGEKLQRQRTEEEENQRKIQKEREEAAKTIIDGKFVSTDLMGTGQAAAYKGEYYIYQEKETPHGKGGILYSGRNYIIHGYFLHGKLITIYKLVFQDNSTYIGDTENEIPHGKGTHKAADDSWEYIGMFKNGLMHGQGIMKLPDKIYEGEFNNNKITGKFKFTNEINGETYEGDLEEAVKHGEGVIKNSRGQIVQQGQYERGVFQKKNE